MAIDPITIGDVSVSRLIIGGNPFSGVSHQGADRDRDMMHWYTVERIKATLTRSGRTGYRHIYRTVPTRHITRMLHGVSGMKAVAIKWIAQTCPEMVSIEREH